MKMIWKLALFFGLVACGQSQDNNSEVKIANGMIEKYTLDKDGYATRAAVGLRFSRSNTSFPEMTCSGFRYGNKTIVTAAHCLDEQVPDHGNGDVYLQLLSATRHSFLPTKVQKIVVHPSYYAGCMRKFNCVDLALITLDESFVSTSEIRTYTDPAVVDYTPGFPSKGDFLVGFGCARTFFWGCSLESGFDDNSYTLAHATAIDSAVKIPPAFDQTSPYYFSIKGVGVEGKPISVAHGDSGGPMLGFADERLSSLPNFGDEDVQLVVDGMMIKSDEVDENLPLGTTANLILDLGHPAIAKWLQPKLDELDKWQGNIPAAGNEKVCSALLDPQGALDYGPGSWKKEDFGSVEVNDALLDEINSIKSKAFRNGFASCFSYILVKDYELERLHPNHKYYKELRSILDMAMLTEMLAMRAFLEYQKTQDFSWFEIAQAYASDTQTVLDGTLVVASFVPGIGTMSDLLIVTTGNDAFGRPVSMEERKLTAAFLLAPGALSVAGKAAKASGKFVGHLASTADKYKGARGVVGRAAKHMETVGSMGSMQIDRVMSVAAKMKTTSVEQLIRFSRLAEKYGCKLISYEAPFFERTLRNVLDFIEPTAYAAGGCDEIQELLMKVTMRYSKAIAASSKQLDDVYQSVFEEYVKYAGKTADIMGLAKLVRGLEKLDAIFISPTKMMHILTGEFSVNNNKLVNLKGGLHTWDGLAMAERPRAAGGIGLKRVAPPQGASGNRGGSVEAVWFSKMGLDNAQAVRKDVIDNYTGPIQSDMESVLKKLGRTEDLESEAVDILLDDQKYISVYNEVVAKIGENSPAARKMKASKEFSQAVGDCSKETVTKKLEDNKTVQVHKLLCNEFSKTLFPKHWSLDDIGEAVHSANAQIRAANPNLTKGAYAVEVMIQGEAVLIEVTYGGGNLISAYPHFFQDMDKYNALKSRVE